jgi:Fe-S cluster biogenesis protein NfuA
LFIQTEQTPNPETVKFYPGSEVSPSCPLDFTSSEEASASPLAQRLYSIEGGKGVFLGADFISVTKSPAADWEVLKPKVLSGLVEHYASGIPVISEPANKNEQESSNENDNETVRLINELLDNHVRPLVAQDGGDIQFCDFKDGVVYLKMRGACAGCPSATMTLKMGVERLLCHHVPKVREVRPVHE